MVKRNPGEVSNHGLDGAKSLFNYGLNGSQLYQLLTTGFLKHLAATKLMVWFGGLDSWHPLMKGIVTEGYP